MAFPKGFDENVRTLLKIFNSVYDEKIVIPDDEKELSIIVNEFHDRTRANLTIAEDSFLVEKKEFGSKLVGRIMIQSSGDSAYILGYRIADSDATLDIGYNGSLPFFKAYKYFKKILFQTFPKYFE